MPRVKAVFHNVPSARSAGSTSPPSSGERSVRAVSIKHANDKQHSNKEPFKSSSVLQQHVATLRDAVRAQHELHNRTPSLRVQLGEALNAASSTTSFPFWAQAIAKGVSTTSLAASTTSATKFSRMAFRQEVRKLVKGPSAKDIDVLFNELDVDGGGTLDLTELRTAMKSLSAMAREHSRERAGVLERIEHLKLRLGQAEGAVEATRAAESAQARLEELRAKRSIEARVGRLLAARNVKVSDCVNSWESTNGEVSKAQFRKNLKSLGLEEGGVLESDALFDSLDLDGGGTLDLDELKNALLLLQEAAKAEDREMAKLRKSTVELAKEAKAAQAELERRWKEDEEARRTAEQQQEEELKRKEEARKEEERRRREAAAEQKKRKAAEKQAFADKVQARRLAAAAAMAEVGGVPSVAPTVLWGSPATMAW